MGVFFYRHTLYVNSEYMISRYIRIIHSFTVVECDKITLACALYLWCQF